MRKILLSNIYPLILLIPFFLFFLGVNILVDPSGLLRKSQEKQIAQWLNDGYGVINAINVDYRKKIKERTLLLNRKPDIVVLGSSRAMVIDSSLFPDQFMLNYSLPSANLEDIIANYQILYEANKLPKELICVLIYTTSMDMRKVHSISTRNITMPLKECRYNNIQP
jgi:hypothetical protein